MSRLLALAGAAALCAGLAEPARAAEFHVAAGATPKADCSNPVDPCPTIAAAVAQARATAGPNTIHVRAGTYDETVALDQASDGGLTLAGAGGAVLAPNAIPGSAIVRVAPPASGVTVRDLRVVDLPANPSDKNLVSVSAAGTLVQRVVGEFQQAASIGFGFAVNGGPVTLDRVETTGTWNGSAINSGPGDYAFTVTDALLRAGTNQPSLSVGAGVRAVVQRSTLRRPNGDGTTVNVDRGTLRLESSLVLGGRVGVQVGSSAASSPALATLRNVTVDAGATLGTADASTTAIRAGASNDGTATLTLASSITVEGQQAEDFQATATSRVTCSDSDVPLKTQAKAGALGVIECDASAGNTTTAAAALFVDAGAGDYHLLPGAPAVDTGTAAGLAPDESTSDRDGNPRVLDGDLDCAARRDRGAYELTGREGCRQPPPTPTPTPTATPTPSPTPAPDRTAPALTRASLASRTIRRGRTTSVRFTVDEASVVQLRIERGTSGRKVAGRCRAATRARRRKPRCTLWRTAATSRRPVPAGRQRLTLPVRRLRAGRYRVVVIARDAAGNASRPARLAFTIG